MDSVRQFIEDFRGGVPSKCDFCQHETPPEKLEPEEAGEWVCHACLDRWRAKETDADKEAERED